VKRLVQFVVLFGLSSFGRFGLASGDAAAEAMLDQLVTFQKKFQEPKANCELPAQGDCSSENLCKALLPQRNSPYLYQNSAGQRVPNFQMVFAADLYTSCLNPVESKSFAATKEDPFLFPELFQKKTHQGSYKSAVQKTKNILDQVKTAMIELLQKKQTSQNQAAIQNFIKRVKLVQLHAVSNFSLQGLADAGCGVPNAFYNPVKALKDQPGHTITICPQLLNFPEPALYATLAHELSHAFDPCAASFALAKVVNAEKGAAQLLDPRHPEIQSPEAVLAKGLTPSENPMVDTIECLQSSESTTVKLPSFAQQIEALERRQLERESLLTPDQQETDKELKRLHHQVRDFDQRQALMGNCAEEEATVQAAQGDKSSEKLNPFFVLRESFSDAISAALVAAKVSKMKDEEAKKWTFEAELMHLQSTCVGFSEGQKETIVRSMKAKKCDTRMIEGHIQFEHQQRTHLSDAARLQKILLAPKEIQKALGCEPKRPVKACL
jgi:hypothetical protein